MQTVKKIITEAFEPVFKAATRMPKVLKSVDADTIRVEQEKLLMNEQYEPWAYEYLSRFAKDCESIVLKYDPEPDPVKEKKGPKYFFSQPSRPRIRFKRSYRRWSKK